MAKNNFLTDKFSTTGGLAAVAYGSSSLFHTVSDQIKLYSKTKATDSQLPSHLVLDYVGTKSFLKDIFYSVLNEEYSLNQEYTDYIDLYVGSVEEFANKTTDFFLREIDKISDYSFSPLRAINNSLLQTIFFYTDSTDLEINTNNLSIQIELELYTVGYIGEDLFKVVSLALNNPTTKISAAPPDSVVQLSVEDRSAKDSKGVERSYGTISPVKYYSGTGFNLEGTSIRKSVIQGYAGYPLVSLLGESLLNPDSYNNLDLQSTSSLVLNEFANDSSLTPAQETIYNLNLTTINLDS